MKLTKTQSGFTLTELLISTAITGMLIVIIMTLMGNTLAQSAVSTAKSDLLREAQITLDRVGNDIRLSAYAEENNRWADLFAPVNGDEYSWESNATTLILASAAMTSNRTIIFDDPLHYITHKDNVIYFVRDGTLYRRVLAAETPNNRASTTCPRGTTGCRPDSPMLNNVTGFTVKYYDGNNDEVNPVNARSVELSIQLQQKKYGQTIKADYSTRTVFRNE